MRVAFLSVCRKSPRVLAKAASRRGLQTHTIRSESARPVRMRCGGVSMRAHNAHSALQQRFNQHPTPHSQMLFASAERGAQPVRRRGRPAALAAWRAPLWARAPSKTTAHINYFALTGFRSRRHGAVRSSHVRVELLVGVEVERQRALQLARPAEEAGHLALRAGLVLRQTPDDGQTIEHTTPSVANQILGRGALSVRCRRAGA